MPDNLQACMRTAFVHYRPAGIALFAPDGIRENFPQSQTQNRGERLGSQGPRLYRTRKDAFESVWDEVRQWLTAQPERTGKSVFDELQQR